LSAPEAQPAALLKGDEMRFPALPVPCLGLALLAAMGCDPARDARFFREGVGTELSRPELAQATHLQDIYIEHLCRQAGFGDSAAHCSAPPPAAWPEIVQAGMNDIDLRCDAYLAWLDDRRRWNRPVLQQISSMRSLAQTILDAAGAGPHSMTVVGNAFGFASSTFTNISSRLLLEVNQSTLQEVVLKNQEKFRSESGYPAVRTRSEAIYMLRMYLRICMPFTIETDINTSVTLVKRGGAALAELSPLLMTEGTIEAGAAPARETRPATGKVSANGPAPEVTGDNALKGVFRDYSPREFPPSAVRKIYNVLCVPRSARDRPGDVVRRHIEIWERTEILTAPADAMIDRRERDILMGKADCPRSKNGDLYALKNYYERQRFADGADPDAADVVELLARFQLPGRAPLPSSLQINDPRVRARIAEVRRALGSDPNLLRLPDNMADHWTRDLADKLIRMRPAASGIVPSQPSPVASPPIVPPSPVAPSPPPLAPGATSPPK
jgi:hypothetical protein